MKNRAPSITRKWKRVLGVGCSHGHLINENSAAAVIKFKESWKPDRVVHLGDHIDTAALRTGAKGSKDESEPIRPDLRKGITFLEELGVTHLCHGNHDIRPYKLMDSTNAIIAEAAQSVCEYLNSQYRRLKIEVLTHWGIKHYFEFGGVRYMHGTIYNEMSPRDMAESYGNVVFAHTHRAGMMKGRRPDNPTGYCVGTLANIDAMEYAQARRATLAWSAGFVFGEYCETESQLWLHENGQRQEWRLPT
jgi:predicted phosphodiesterase